MTVAHLETAQADTATHVPELLSAAYHRLDAVCEALSVRVAEPGKPTDRQPSGPTHSPRVALRTVGLMDGQESVEAFVEAEAARIQTRYDHSAPRHVAASRALHDYAWSVGLLMSGVWCLERRVPRISPADIRVDLATGAFEIRPGSDLVCLPDDPAAGLPGARAVAHQESLRAELRAAVADHMGPVLDAIGPYARRGSRALWGLVSDDLVSGLWYLGRMRGDEAMRRPGRLRGPPHRPRTLPRRRRLPFPPYG